ncbi:hypothetical protein ACFFX1_36775 [Dactylosporangium sucinum]|uniref:hypothetical protein n=1 Tax=Dactylosporangium sucinum TaxID=1424081 RepID=UPI00167C87B0|nr:hypothetical protein [Dactylosporangium sucinum]
MITTAVRALAPELGLFIGGTWTGAAATFLVLGPATGKPLASVADGNAADATASAGLAWAATPPRQRSLPWFGRRCSDRSHPWSPRAASDARAPAPASRHSPRRLSVAWPRA